MRSRFSSRGLQLEEDVLRLQVQVAQPAAVHVLERLQHLRGARGPLERRGDTDRCTSGSAVRRLASASERTFCTLYVEESFRKT